MSMSRYELLDLLQILKKNRFLRGSTRRRIGEKITQGKGKDAPYICCWYAHNILGNQPFPLAEPLIATNASHACWYALNVLHGRFPLAETTIAKDPQVSLTYYTHIIHPDFVGSIVYRDRMVKEWRRKHGANL